MRWPSARRAKAQPPQNPEPRPRELRTERLRLRPLDETHAGPLHSFWSAPEVRKFLWDGRALAFEQTRDIVARSARLFDESGLGLWGAFSDDEALLGFCGYWYFHDERELELMLALGASYQLRGLAGEMTRALLGYGFFQLHLENVRASVQPLNLACIQLLTKLGFVASGQHHQSNGKIFYTLPRSRYVSEQANWEAA